VIAYGKGWRGHKLGVAIRRGELWDGFSFHDVVFSSLGNKPV